MATLPEDLDSFIRTALEEDDVTADVTSAAVVPEEARVSARAVAREAGVVAGLPLFVRVFELVGPDIEVRTLVKEGDRVEEDAALAELRGPARSVLAGERVALNFLTHLSGVATLTRAYVDACVGTGSVILHTRKTLPGLRALQRYAVEVGGGRLHRGSLSDGVLIKDNHVLLAGGVGEAVRRARATAGGGRIQAEVDTLDQLREALEAGADAVLLDNADLETVKRAVEIVNGRVPLEISGGVRLDAVPDIAAAGDLLISVGRLTHSAPALDIALDLEPY